MVGTAAESGAGALVSTVIVGLAMTTTMITMITLMDMDTPATAMEFQGMATVRFRFSLALISMMTTITGAGIIATSAGTTSATSTIRAIGSLTDGRSAMVA